MILASLALSFLPALQETPAQEPVRRSGEGAQAILDTVDQLQVVYLANAGFMLRLGNFSILIDAFVKDSFEGYEGLPKNAARKLQNAEKPFTGFSFGLVSHLHPDHFQPRVAERFLRANPDAALMSGPQVVNRLVQGATDFKSIRRQARAIGTKPGEPKVLDFGRTKVEFLQLPHMANEADTKLQNYAHLIHVAGFKVLHVGDAAPDREAFEPFGFADRDIDIALLPYWFFSEEESVKLVDELIHADHVVLYHMPVAEKELYVERMKLANPEVILFENTFDSIIFENAQPEDATAGGG